MAIEIVCEHDTSGVALYAVVSRPADGYRWNGSSFETHTAGNWLNYDIALTEQTNSATYLGDFPAGITTAGWYRITVYLRAGGSPAIGDTKLASGTIAWNGTAEDPFGMEALTVEGSITPSSALINDSGTQLSRINGKQALALYAAALGGTLSGATGGSGATITITPVGLSTPTRVTATADSVGNRTPTLIRVPN
jgi:hypothetical protein